MTRFRIDKSWRRPLSGDTVIGGSPLKIFRLTEAGRSVAEKIEAREVIPEQSLALAHRFLDAGAIVPVLEPIDSSILEKITVVIPIFAREKHDADALKRLMEGFSSCAQVLVIDDCSPYPLMGEISPVGNCQVMRNEWNMGPAGARNVGLASTNTELIAFVDADTEVSQSEICLLASHFKDSSIVAVAPRIKGAEQSNSVFAKFEEANCPLDLGDESARVRKGSRVSYVPSACLLARTEVVRSEGGFDPELRTGEDVDLIWRLDSVRHWVLYESAVEVHHHARTEIWSWLQQRRGYGSSAAPLAKRHDGALAPVVANRWSIAIVALAFTKKRWLCVPIIAYTSLSLGRKLSTLPNRWYESVRLTLRGHLFTAIAISKALSRVWLPLLVTAAVFSKNARRLLAGTSIALPLITWARSRPRLDPFRYIALKFLDDAAYATGVWQSCVRERNAGALIPRISR